MITIVVLSNMESCCNLFNKIPIPLSVIFINLRSLNAASSNEVPSVYNPPSSRVFPDWHCSGQNQPGLADNR